MRSRDKVTTLYKVMDQHLKSAKIDVAAVQNEWQELDVSSLQVCKHADCDSSTMSPRQLPRSIRTLRTIWARTRSISKKSSLPVSLCYHTCCSSADNDRSAFLRSASENGNRIRKRTLDKLREDDQVRYFISAISHQIQTDAGILTDMLYKLKGIETV
jgi:hypothetical protein